MTESVDNASTSAHKAIDKVSEAVQPAVERNATGAHQVVDKIAGAATKVTESLDNGTAQVKNMATRLCDCCSTSVREKPLRTLGYAVAAGFVLSWLTKKR